MRDMVVYPRMISPVFIEPGANLLAIQEAQIDETTMIALVQQDSDVTSRERKISADWRRDCGGRLLSLADGNSSALVQGRRRVELVEFTQTEPYYRARVRPIYEPVDVTARSMR
jgi:ATP-dependent Lon protease